MEDKILELCEKVINGEIQDWNTGHHCSGIDCEEDGCPFASENNGYGSLCCDLNKNQVLKIAKEYMAANTTTETPVLSLQEALDEKYEGRKFKVKENGYDLVVQLVDEEFEIIIINGTKEDVCMYITDYVSLKGLLNCKFELIEEELTLDSFGIEEEFAIIYKTSEKKYTCKKVELYGQEFLVIRFDNEIQAHPIDDEIEYFISLCKFKRIKN